MEIIGRNPAFQQSIKAIWGDIEPSMSRDDIKKIVAQNYSRWSNEPRDCVSDHMGAVTRLAQTRWIPIFRHVGEWLLAQKYEQQFFEMERLPKWLGGKQTTFLHAELNDIPLLYGPTSKVPRSTLVAVSFGLHSNRHETVYGVYGEIDGKDIYEFLIDVNSERKKTMWAQDAGLVPQWLASALELEPAH